MTRRFEYIDIAKGLGIIAIVLGHLGFKSFIHPDGVDTIVRVVFQFHVPLFFILAGYTLSKRQCMGEFVISKAKRLLIPYVCTCLVILGVMLFLHVTRGEMHPPTYYSDLKEFFVSALWGAGSKYPFLPEGVNIIGAIWFLEALLIALVELRFLIDYLDGIPLAVAVFLIAAVSAYTLSFTYVPCNVQVGLLGGAYVYLGYLFRKYELFERLTPPVLAVFALIFVFAFVNNITVSLVRAYFHQTYLGIPVSITSSLLVIGVARLIETHSHKLKDTLLFFGKNSLTALCVHLILLDCGLKWTLIHAGVSESNNVLFLVNFCVQMAIIVASITVVNAVKAFFTGGSADVGQSRA